MADYRTPRRPASRRIGVELRRCGILNFHIPHRNEGRVPGNLPAIRLSHLIKMESRPPFTGHRFSVLSASFY